MDKTSNSEIVLQILLSLGLIIIAAKYLGTLAKKIGIPQVAGMIVAGLLLRFIPWFSNFGKDAAGTLFGETDQFIGFVAEIGVIMIMYSAGLGTSLKSLMKSGVKSTVIALCGVLIPMALGTVVSLCFPDFWQIDPETKVWLQPEFYKALFIGTILTATSVSISVASLQELGKLKSDIGQTIVSAAIIDDVFGIIALTIVLGISSGNGGSDSVMGKWIADTFKLNSGAGSIIVILILTVLFFIAAIGFGLVIFRLFKWYDRRHPHSRRIPIYGMGIALIYSFCAEKFFGIADITGAYIAGVVFCSLTDAPYMEQKIDINSYMIFSPVFFASIGLKTDLSAMNMELLWFSIAFVLVGCIAKIIGCGGVSKLMGFSWKESYQIGLGMMVRGEVALIVAQKGLSVGMVDSKYFAAVILLIIVSSMIVPVLLKKAFAEKKQVES